MGNNTIFCELKNVTKVFPGVTAMDRMSIQLKAGEVHGLIGENGAGKSTLIKVLTGMYIPDGGEMFINGVQVAFKGPLDAKEAGISCVYQELNLAGQLSVVDNMFVGGQYKTKTGLLDYKRMNLQAKEILASMHQDNIDVTKPVNTLGIGHQQMVEIAKGMRQNAKLFILDEPTASLDKAATDELFRLVREMKAKGMAVLFVSHKLDELFELCDVVTVMRNGQFVATKPIHEVNNTSLVEMMIGRSVDNYYPRHDTYHGETALEVKNATRAGEYYDCSFKAARGEITGFFGLVGAGRSELMKGVFGAVPMDSGEVWIDGKEQHFKSAKDAIGAGMAFLTEDRKGEGLLLSRTIKENLTIVHPEKYCKGIFLDEKKLEEIASWDVERFKIRTSSLDKIAVELSGGNQQKVVIGKWVNSDADIYIFDETTKGIDVGAKVDVFDVMGELAASGKCVIMISSELPEILGIADRTYVMRTGRIMCEIERSSKHFNQKDILAAAWGEKLDDGEGN